MDGQTLQMNLVFGALNQNGADRVEVVIVAASERPGPGFCHLQGGGEKTVECLSNVRCLCLFFF